MTTVNVERQSFVTFLSPSIDPSISQTLFCARANYSEQHHEALAVLCETRERLLLRFTFFHLEWLRAAEVEVEAGAVGAEVAVEGHPVNPSPPSVTSCGQTSSARRKSEPMSCTRSVVPWFLVRRPSKDLTIDVI